jgi:putative Holliday junction resolvase
MEAPGPALGLDFGRRRIGLAVSDAEGIFAFPAGAIERTNHAKDLAALADVIRERGVRCIVLGLPLHLDGRAGEMADAVRAFAGELERVTGLPVELMDERWTTREAERALHEAGRPRGRRRRGGRGDVDAAAAAILLRTWLERRRARAGEAP